MKSIYNLFFILVAATVLNSCAGSPTKTTHDDYNDASTTSSVQEAEIEPTPEVKAEVRRKTPAAEEALMQAIKRQSDSEIIKAANDLLILNPSNLKALNALGVLNYKKSRYKAAEYFLNKALKAHPQEPAIYNNLALVQLAQNEPREAVKLFKAGLSQKSGDMAISTNLGSILVANKDYANAEIALEPAYDRGSKDMKAVTNYAVALAANKKNDEASKIYQRLLDDNSSSREIMLNYSIHLIENVKDYKKGLDLISRLKFVGVPDESRNVINQLENKAKAGLK